MSQGQSATPTPRAGDPLDILLAHDHGSTRTLLVHCRPLTKEQFHRTFPMGPAERGGLHLTFTHIISAMGRWADRITGVQPVRAPIEPFPWAPPPPHTGQPQPDVKDRTVDELLTILEKNAADLRAAAKFSREKGLGSVMTMRSPQPGGLSEERSITRAGALMHILTHGSWHRAQCTNIIRQLGVAGVSDRLPDLQVVEWQLKGEAGLP